MWWCELNDCYNMIEEFPPVLAEIVLKASKLNLF